MKIIFEPETSEEKILAAKYTFNKVPKKGYHISLDRLSANLRVILDGNAYMCQWK